MILYFYCYQMQLNDIDYFTYLGCCESSSSDFKFSRVQRLGRLSRLQERSESIPLLLLLPRAPSLGPHHRTFRIRSPILIRKTDILHQSFWLIPHAFTCISSFLHCLCLWNFISSAYAENFFYLKCDNWIVKFKNISFMVN